MSDRVFELFDDYAAAYARGDRPNADDYLARAGDERAELAELLGEFLTRTPAPAPTEDDVRMLGLMVAEEPPLLRLRLQRHLKVDDVVSALIGRLGLAPEATTKVKQYYQRLEGGLLDPSGVSRRVRSVLAEILGAPAEEAVAWSATKIVGTAFFRGETAFDMRLDVATGREAPEDEVDRLFTGGDDG